MSSPSSRRAILLVVAFVSVVVLSLVALGWLGRTGEEASGAGGVPLAVPQGERWSASPAAAPGLGDEAATGGGTASAPRLVMPAAGPPALPAADELAPGEASAEAASLVLAVTTRRSPSGGELVPHMAIAAGLGAPLDPTRAPLVLGRTGADGTGELSLPFALVEEARARGDSLWLRVVEPGYLQRTQTRRLPEAPGVLELRLIAYPGSTLRGRVVDAEGRPRPAQVRVTPGDPAGGPMGLGKADDDGWFEVTFTRAGSAQVVADGGEHGTAALLGLELEMGAQHDPIELVLGGPGVIRGRVRDSAGRPAAGLDLEVVAAGHGRLLAEAAGQVVPWQSADALDLEGRGRARVETRTGANGEFEVRGLRDDLFLVRIPSSGPFGSSAAVTLHARPVRSDGEHLELVRSRPHIAVRVVDERGEPWPEPLAPHEPSPRLFGGSSADWPAQTRVALHVIDPQPGHFAEMPDWLAGRAVEGEVVFEVPAGRAYLLGLLGGDQLWRPVEVLVPSDAARVEARLVMDSGRESGTLLIGVRAPGKAPLEGLVVRVEHPTTGAALLERSSFYGAGEVWRLELPEGEYRVVVDAQPHIGWHGDLYSRRGAGRLEAEVRIHAGQVTRVEGTLPSGARVAIQLQGAATAADRTAIEERYAGMTVGWDNWEERFSSLAQLFLRAEGRQPIPVIFVEVPEQHTGARERQSSYLALGEAAVSELLPAGRFTLEARLPAGRIASAPVTLVDGATTEVVLAFD